MAPSTSWSDEGPTPEPVTFGELVEMEAITVTPLTDEQDVHFMVWVGDEALLHHDDDAPLQLDDALAAQPGIEQVDWEDREVLMVTAPDLCDTALEAAVAAALADPRVRS
ncbi:hypothetical protein [Ornithinimicrobium cavernae]|uniref:hypothetical protein n=1 Tax=Ornithinimicrobium cavernae TaxID=2666047 RepID=UPI0012B17700|nr:hypothetical protein [Ornithinimicrobium cavernae]